MGFFKTLTGKIFGGGKAKPKGRPASVPRSPATFTPIADEAEFTLVRDEPYDVRADDLLQDPLDEIGIPPGSDEAEFTPMGEDGEETKFLGGEPISVHSSNVSAIQYLYANGDRLIEQLYITYHDGSVYSYDQISLEEAKDLYRAGSYGKWVWSHLRVRGTVFGYQKPYRLVSGHRVWHAAGADSIARHDAIPASGEAFDGYHPAFNYEGAKGGMGAKGQGVNLGKKGGSKKVAHFTPIKAKPKGGGLFGPRP